MPFTDSIVPCNVKFHFKCGLSVAQCKTSHVKLAKEKTCRVFQIGQPHFVLDLHPSAIGGVQSEIPDLALLGSLNERSKGRAGISALLRWAFPRLSHCEAAKVFVLTGI